MVPSDITVGGQTPDTGPNLMVRRNSVAIATGVEVESDSGDTDCWFSGEDCVRKVFRCSSLYRGDSVVSGSGIVEFARTGSRIVEFVRADGSRIVEFVGTEVMSTASDCKEGFDSPEHSMMLLDF